MFSHMRLWDSCTPSDSASPRGVRISAGAIPASYRPWPHSCIAPYRLVGKKSSSQRVVMRTSPEPTWIANGCTVSSIRQPSGVNPISDDRLADQPPLAVDRKTFIQGTVIHAGGQPRAGRSAGRARP